MSSSLFFRLWALGGRRVRITIGIAALASTIGCSAQGGPEASNSEPSGTVRIGVPESDSETGEIGFRQVWLPLTLETLTARGSDGRPQPRIAEEWSVSPDGLTWQIRLRPNVTFHDGEPFDATTAKRVLEAVLPRPGGPTLYPGLLDIDEIGTEDSRTLLIRLRRPSAFLIEDLDILLTKKGADGKAIGTGPYKPVSIGADEVLLQAHESYHLGPPRIRELVVKVYPTLRLAWASLLRGEIDVVWNVSADALEFIRRSDTVNTFSYPRHYAYVITFNSARPQLKPAGVRRALNAAVDRNALVQSVLKGRAEPADSPVWPKHWAYDQSVRGYSYDPSLAMATLDALGVKMREANGTTVPARLRFKCIVPEGHAIHERLALLVQRQLYDVGVDMQLESRPMSEVDVLLRKGDFDAVIIDLASAPTFSRVYIFWHSPGAYQGPNIFGYRSGEADKWLDRLRHASDDASTRSAASQLQRVLMDDPPALFLAWSQQSRAISRRIVVPTEPGRNPFLDLFRWEIRDQPVSTEQ